MIPTGTVPSLCPTIIQGVHLGIALTVGKLDLGKVLLGHAESCTNTSLHVAECFALTISEPVSEQQSTGLSALDDIGAKWTKNEHTSLMTILKGMLCVRPRSPWKCTH